MKRDIQAIEAQLDILTEAVQHRPYEVALDGADKPMVCWNVGDKYLRLLIGYRPFVVQTSRVGEDWCEYEVETLADFRGNWAWLNSDD